MNKSVMKFTPAMEPMSNTFKTAHEEIQRLHRGLTKIDNFLKSGRVQAARDEIAKIQSGKSDEDHRLSNAAYSG